MITIKMMCSCHNEREGWSYAAGVEYVVSDDRGRWLLETGRAHLVQAVQPVETPEQKLPAIESRRSSAVFEDDFPIRGVKRK